MIQHHLKVVILTAPLLVQLAGLAKEIYPRIKCALSRRPGS